MILGLRDYRFGSLGVACQGPGPYTWGLGFRAS